MDKSYLVPFVYMLKFKLVVRGTAPPMRYKLVSTAVDLPRQIYEIIYISWKRENTNF